MSESVSRNEAAIGVVACWAVSVLRNTVLASSDEWTPNLNFPMPSVKRALAPSSDQIATRVGRASARPWAST